MQKTELDHSAQVSRVVSALSAAESDTEKLAALFLVPKVVKADMCSKQDRIDIVTGIGFSFLARMLRSNDSASADPNVCYRSLALSVLACFAPAADSEIVAHPAMLVNVPVLFDVIAEDEDEGNDDHLVEVRDAYDILSGVVASSVSGREAVVNARGVHTLCGAIHKQSFLNERALQLLVSILSTCGTRCWQYPESVTDFSCLMQCLARDFSETQEMSKFETCDTLRVAVSNFPKSLLAAASETDESTLAWLPALRKGLADILFSKISKQQRDPALKLVAAVIEATDAEWCLEEDSQAKGKFFLILVNLACIELVMQLEDSRPMEELLSDADLIASCYVIVESAVSGLCGDGTEDEGWLSVALQQKQRLQICSALKNAFAAVIAFIKRQQTSTEGQESPNKSLQSNGLCGSSDSKARNFVWATVRVLAAWLAEETSSLREDVYEVLPYIFGLASESLERCRPGPALIALQLSLEAPGDEPELLGFLLPGLCHLVSETRPRQILLDLRLADVLHSFLVRQWTVMQKKVTVAKLVSKQIEKSQMSGTDSLSAASARVEASSLRYSVMTACNVLMNVAVLEPERVQADPAFTRILKFLTAIIPDIENRGETLVLSGTCVVLSLLLLKAVPEVAKAGEFSLSQYAKAVVRFFWDAHNCDSLPDKPEVSEAGLVVSLEYMEHWAELDNLWTLGMQILGHLVQSVRWLGDFVVDSSWSSELVSCLKRSQVVVPASTKTAVEELLCGLVLAGCDIRAGFDSSQVLDACRKHQLDQLEALLQRQS